MVIKFKVKEDRPFYGKFWPKGVPHQLDYDYSMNLKDLMDNAAKKWPNDNAIWFLNSYVTYSQLKDYIDRFSTALNNMGVKKGDVVALLLPNCIQYVVCFYAISSIGAIITGINPTYKSAEVLHQLKLTDSKYLVVLDALYKDLVKPIVDKWTLQKVISTNIVDLATGLSKLKKILGKKIKDKKTGQTKIPTGIVDHPNTLSFLECLNTPPNPPKVTINTEEDTATLIMTGGTTGVPKAADLTHMNVVSNAKQLEFALLNQRDEGSSQQLGHKTCVIGVLPLFHSFAMSVVMNISIAVGAWMVLFAKPPPTEELLKEVTALPNPNGSMYPGAEILFQRIAELPEEIIDKYNFKGRITFGLSGAGPLHDYVRVPFEKKAKAVLIEGYGLSETSPVVSGNNLYGIREAGYIGVPMPGTDWEIFDAEDFSKGPIKKLGEEGTGEICVCGPQVMKGYFKNPDQTKDHIKTWDGRNWLLTGDIGFMDEHGRIQIRDRKKQLIKMSGHSVFPKEVEELLGQHPAVLEVAVAGVKDQKTGEAVKAWVQIKPDHKGNITPEELLKWANENMSHYKCPKYIEIIDQIPHNAIGKVMRRTLSEADPLNK